MQVLRYSFTTAIVLLALMLSANASRVEGYVYDETGQPLPYCNIYEKSTSNGCASNELGYYSIQLPEGEHLLIFQYIGYKKKEVAVNTTNGDVQLSVTLELDIRELTEVVISSGSENPAYEIIRNAIEQRDEHFMENDAYSCEVYMKGLQKLTEAPESILGIDIGTVFDVDSNNTGIIYFSESVSNFYYQYPGKTKEVMIASKVSGNNDQFSWNDARSLQMEFYQNFIPFEGFSQRGFISPIADNAFFFYDYKLLGSFIEDGTFINKIQVIPRRETDPVFSGTIYIRDNDFRIYGIDLITTTSNGLEFLDTFHVAQEFIRMHDDRWVLVSNKFEFSFSVFGLQGNGYFNGFYKNYNLQPGFTEDFFGPEVSVIEEGSNKMDTLFWNNARPIPLTNEEVPDYKVKDSLVIIKESPAYKDSVDRIFNRFKLINLVSGYNYRKSTQNLFINTSSLPQLLNFNTVEGWVLNPSLRIDKTFESKQHLTITPECRYGFANNRFSANGLLTFEYDHIASGKVSLEGGIKPASYNPKGISPFLNSLYSLFLEENYLKLYDKTYLTASHEKELLNGFTLFTGIEFSKRTQLFNAAEIEPLIDIEDVAFTSNHYPFYPDDSILTPDRRMLFELRIRFTPKQQYMTTPNNKYILETKYPVVIAQYKKSVPGIFNSDINFDYIALHVSDHVKLGIYGNLEYNMMAGGFIQHQNVRYEDMIHFAGNETWFGSLDSKAFMLLPYYFASGTDPFFEYHMQWHTEGFLFNKLPLFKQLKLQPVFTLNYLNNETTGNYVEVAAGIEHLFKFVRIDFAYTPYNFEEAGYNSEKFKLVLGLGF